MIRERLFEAGFHFVDLVLHDLDGLGQELFGLVRASGFDAICETKQVLARHLGGRCQGQDAHR